MNRSGSCWSFLKLSEMLWITMIYDDLFEGLSRIMKYYELFWAILKYSESPWTSLVFVVLTSALYCIIVFFCIALCWKFAWKSNKVPYYVPQQLLTIQPSVSYKSWLLAAFCSIDNFLYEFHGTSRSTILAILVSTLMIVKYLIFLFLFYFRSGNSLPPLSHGGMLTNKDRYVVYVKIPLVAFL